MNRGDVYIWSYQSFDGLKSLLLHKLNGFAIWEFFLMSKDYYTLHLNAVDKQQYMRHALTNGGLKRLRDPWHQETHHLITDP